jgi:hypothetical protein
MFKQELVGGIPGSKGVIPAQGIPVKEEGLVLQIQAGQ